MLHNYGINNQSDLDRLKYYPHTFMKIDPENINDLVALVYFMNREPEDTLSMLKYSSDNFLKVHNYFVQIHKVFIVKIS